MTLYSRKPSLSRASVLLFLVSQIAGQSAGLNARISLHTEGTGFHRIFFYRVDLDGYNQENCHVAIYLELPSALYVNVDELDDLRRVGVSTACSVGETDVELFMEKARPQNVTVCTRLLSAGSVLQLPIHQRYQYARDGGGYTNVSMPRPKLLLGCKDRIKGHRISKINLCSPCVDLMPKWREIPYTMDNGDFVWLIPVGDSSLLTMIIYTTLLVTMLGAMYLTRVILKAEKPQEIRKTD